MNALSVCSGAGGFDYAAQHLLGWRTRGYVEIADHPQRCIVQRIEPTQPGVTPMPTALGSNIMWATTTPPVPPH